MLSSSESYRLEEGPRGKRRVASLLCSRSHLLPNSEWVSNEGAGILSSPVRGKGTSVFPESFRLGRRDGVDPFDRLDLLLDGPAT